MVFRRCLDSALLTMRSGVGWRLSNALDGTLAHLAPVGPPGQGTIHQQRERFPPCAPTSHS